MKTQMIALSEILEDTSYQLRDSSQGKNIPELKRLLGDGFELKPIVVRWTVKGYLIIDGYQRVEATRQVHEANAEIKARVCKVTHKVAITMAAAANQAHGGQLEKADRKKIAITLLLEFPKKSNVQIAKLAYLSEGTIRNYRKEMPEAQSETRIGSDEREISLPKKLEALESSTIHFRGLSDTEDSSPVAEKASPVVDEVISDNPVGSYDTGNSDIEEITNYGREKPAISKLNKFPSEVDILLGRFNDLSEHIESARSFLNSAADKEVLSAAEKSLVNDLQDIVHQLEVFK